MRRICNGCGAEKDISDFYKGKRKCKPCLNAYSSAWRKANPELTRANQRRVDAKRKHRRHNPEHIRKWKLKSIYGISSEQYESMFQAQGGCCAVCGCIGSLKPGSRSASLRLHVDHDHDSGAVRGLLCGHCNKAEGLIRSSKNALALAAYMERHGV